jgi:hypothetical protein
VVNEKLRGWHDKETEEKDMKQVTVVDFMLHKEEAS